MQGYVTQPPVAAHDTFGQPVQPAIVYIVNQTSLPSACCSRKYEKYKGKLAAVLGAAQIFLAVLCVVMASLALLIGASLSQVYFAQYANSHGIFSPVLWIIAGAFGLASARSKTGCTIVTTMVMSIISATTCSYIVILQGFFVAEDCDSAHINHWAYDHEDKVDRTKQNEMLAYGIILLIVGVAEGIVAIIAAAICCHATCCCRAAQAEPINADNMLRSALIPLAVRQPTASQATADSEKLRLARNMEPPEYSEQQE